MSIKMVFAVAIILVLIPLPFGIYDYIVNKKMIDEIKERPQNKKPSPSAPCDNYESDEPLTNVTALGFTAVQM